jgi:predicted  nucleic acid-binding Zn-ribbon protein
MRLDWRRRFGAALLCLAFLEDPALVQAAEPEWWTNQKRACGLPPGLAYNSWDGQCGSHSPPPPPPSIDPAVAARAQFQVVFDRVRAFVPGLEASNINGESLEGLSRRADGMFVAAAFRLDTLQSEHAGALKSIQDLSAQLRQMTEQVQTLQSSAAAVPETLRQAAQQLAAEQGYAEAMEARLRTLESKTQELRGRADAAAANIVGWLTVAAPANARLIPVDVLATRKKAEVKAMAVPMRPIQLRPDRPALPVVPNVVRPPGPRAAPQGNLATKLASIDQLVPQLQTAIGRIEADRMEFQRVKQLHADAQRQIDFLQTAARDPSARLGSIEADINEAQFRQSDATSNGLRAAGNALGVAVESYILETFQQRVVVPEVTRFLRDNGYTKPLDDSMMGQLYKDGRLVMDAASERYKSVPRFIDLAKQANAVVNDYMNYAQAAADALGTGEHVRAANLINATGTKVDDQGLGFMEAVAGDSGPGAKIGRFMLGR